MKSTKEISHLDLFYAIQVELSKRGKKEFKVNHSRWHRAYFDAKLEFPEAMENFEAIFSVNPYLQGLEDGIRDSISIGYLSVVSHYPNRIFKTENISGLKKHLSKVDKNTKKVAKYICDFCDIVYEK